MKRNRGGERDLDHIILAAIRGLDLASLEYPQVRAGLILMMDRTFTPHQNLVIVEKALRYAPRGIVGIDIAGPRPGGERWDYRQIAPHVEAARVGHFGVTIHVGEEAASTGRRLARSSRRSGPTGSGTGSCRRRPGADGRLARPARCSRSALRRIS
jgi:adenosine deaminase